MLMGGMERVVNNMHIRCAGVVCGCEEGRLGAAAYVKGILGVGSRRCASGAALPQEGKGRSCCKALSD